MEHIARGAVGIAEANHAANTHLIYQGSASPIEDVARTAAGGPQTVLPAKEKVMQYQTMPLRNEDLPPTKPAIPVDDNRVITIGAWAGICFALALLSAAAVILIRPPEAPRPGEQARITLPSSN